MNTDNGASLPTVYRETIAGNLRAYRAKRHLHQTDVVREMRSLGFTNWHRPTVGRVENCQRAIAAEEIIGLAQVLGIQPGQLLAD